MTFLITGASGFIGRHLCASLTRQGQPVLAMLRQPGQLHTLRQTVTGLGGNADLIDAVQGDLDQPGLGLPPTLPPLQGIIHLGARFGWGLSTAEARRTNVDGALAVADLAARQQCRLVLVSGFMLEVSGHLAALGITSDPDATDWRRVYRRTGSYEASKLEAAVRVRARCARQSIDLVEVQPAAVAGHSVSGDLDPAQPLYSLIDNLAHGRLALVPGSPQHWLPLVPVDFLADLIAAASLAQQPPGRLLALDPATPSMQGLLAEIAATLGRRPPQRHMPLALLDLLLRLPGMPALLGTSREALAFIRTQRFDTGSSQTFAREQGLAAPATLAAIRASSRVYATEKGLSGRVAPPAAAAPESPPR